MSQTNKRPRRAKNKLPLALAVVIGGVVVIALGAPYFPTRSVVPGDVVPQPVAPRAADAGVSVKDVPYTRPTPDAPKSTVMMGQHPAIAGLHMTATERQFDTHFNTGVAHMQVAQYESALSRFRQAAALRPNVAALQANMGFVFLSLKRTHEAKTAFERAISINDQQVNAYYGLASSFEKLGNIPVALAAMETFLHLTNGQDPFARKAEAAIWEWRDAIDRKRKAANNKKITTESGSSIDNQKAVSAGDTKELDKNSPVQ